MAALKNLVEVCSRSRRSLSTLSRIVWKPNYNRWVSSCLKKFFFAFPVNTNNHLTCLIFFSHSYTDDEAHAELVYAEALLMISLMTFLGDQNLINLVKGAFRIRSCFQVSKLT